MRATVCSQLRHPASFRNSNHIIGSPATTKKSPSVSSSRQPRDPRPHPLISPVDLLFPVALRRGALRRLHDSTPFLQEIRDLLLDLGPLLSLRPFALERHLRHVPRQGRQRFFQRLKSPRLLRF